MKITGLRFEGIELNKTDLETLKHLSTKNYSVGELTRELKIAPINTWKRLKKLSKDGFIKVPIVERGKKKVVSLKTKGKRVNKFINYAEVF